jgi:hypothetical protein
VSYREPPEREPPSYEPPPVQLRRRPQTSRALLIGLAVILVVVVAVYGLVQAL